MVPLHIGVLTHNYPRFPGDFSGSFIHALCHELAHQGQNLTLFAPYDPAYTHAGIVHNSQSTIYNLQLISLSLYRYIWPDRFHRLGYMRSMQSDLALRLESYLLSPGLFVAGIIHVVRQVRKAQAAGHPFDILHAHWLLPNGFIAAVVSRIMGIPLVVSIPGSDAQVARANPLFRRMARFAFNQASLLTANSADLRSAVVEIGADPARFDLILYGVDPNELQPDETGVTALRERLGILDSELPIMEYDSSVQAGKEEEYEYESPSCRKRSDVTLSPRHPFTLLCVGRMVYKKGFDVMIRALAEPELSHRDLRLIMIGDGDQKAEWQALAAELGVAEKILWVGTIPKDEIGVYYNLADVLVMPSVSRPADGLNVCVLDAMSCATPVVGTNVAGNPLAIVDGKTGFIVPEGDAQALARALAQLADDEPLRQRLGRASRARVENELSWPYLARRYIEHFQELVSVQ